MLAITARDALTAFVARVGATARPQELWEALQGGATFAVFEDSAEGLPQGRFLGLVSDREVALHPGRIFADLLPRPAAPGLAPDLPIEQVFEELDRSQAGGLAVVLADGGLLGVVTRGSAVAALIRSQRAGEGRAAGEARPPEALSLERMGDEFQRQNARAQTLLRLLGRVGSSPELVRDGLEALRAIVGARYGILSIFSEAGGYDRFVFSGVSPEDIGRIGEPPKGHGLLGVMVEQEAVLRVEDMSRDPRRAGFPPNHPAMTSLIGAPIGFGGRVFGRVYFCDKENGARFTEGDEVLLKTFSETLGLWVAFVRAMEERQRLQERLRQVEKLEAVGRLATGVAHDFNNVLMTVLGYCDVLLGTAAGAGDWRGKVAEIRKAVERGSVLTRSLLSLGRGEGALDRGVLALNGAVAELLPGLRHAAGEGVEVSFAPAHAVGAVVFGRADLERVLTNLVVNARDAMPEGGRITIRTARAGSGGERGEAGEGVLLEVADTGGGISPELLPKIFEPFFSTKDQGAGSGLGLFIVWGMVNAAGGRVEAESVVGSGTTFRVYLSGAAGEAPPGVAPDPDVADL